MKYHRSFLETNRWKWKCVCKKSIKELMYSSPFRFKKGLKCQKKLSGSVYERRSLMWDLSPDNVWGGCVLMPSIFPLSFLCFSVFHRTMSSLTINELIKALI